MDLGIVDEELPNARSGSGDIVNRISGIAMLSPNVLVTTTSENVFDQDSLKTARIIIHNPSSLNAFKNAHQTITFNPLNRSLSVPEKNNSFDPSIYENVLPVRCRNVRGELHKNKFGSGNRGRSILVNGTWYTPSEFEVLCGRGNSKDWKRSIRFGGRTLMCLIDQGVLRPHAASCTCGACCEDGSAICDGTPDLSSGPVRLFTPYKRRRRQHPRLKVSTNVQISNADNIGSAPAELPTTEVAIGGAPSETITTLTVPIVTRDSSTVVAPDSVIVAPEAKSQIPRSASNTVDISEQRQWWQLEEIVKSTVRQVLDLQKQVETLKSQSVITREIAMQELRTQLETEKKEALSACRLESQLSLSRAISEAKSEREAAVQQAVEQSRLEMEEKINSLVAEKIDISKRCANCDREAFSDCTGCRRVSYCSAFCQKKDWMVHKDDCGEQVLDADCSEMVDDGEDTGS